MASSHPVQITIGATLAASLGAAVRGAQAQLTRLGTTMAELGNKKAGIAQLEGLRGQAKDAAVAWRAAQQRVRQIESSHAAQGSAPTARQTRELDRARAQATRAEAIYRGQRREIDNLSTSLTQSGVNIRRMGAESVRLGSQLDLLRTRTERLTRAQQAQTRNLENRSAYRAQMMDVAALGASLYGLVKPAVAFESVMADVKKVVDFDSASQFAAMSKEVLLLSTRIPMTAEGIGQIVAAAGQAGIQREELLRFADDAAKMGVAFDLSGAEAGAAMTGLRTIFGLTQDKVVSLGDAINYLSNNMDAKAGQLLQISNRAGSTAKLFGLSGQQLSALGASFLALKTAPEVAATGINALLMKLATADKQGEKFQEALYQIGLSSEVVKKMIGRDAQGAIVTFLDRVKAAPDVMGTLADLFGMEYADDIAKLVGSLDTYKKAIGLVGDETKYTGSMQKEYEARAATTANNLQLLSNRMTRLGVTIGNALLPALNNLVGVLSVPIDSLARFAERFPLVTKVVVGTVGAIAALKIATIALGYAWTFLKGPVLAAQVAFQSARAGLTLLRMEATMTGASTNLLAIGWARLKTSALGLAMPIKTAAIAFWSMLPAIGATTAALLANPITWIVVGIGAAIAGLALVVRKYWDPIAAYLGGVFEGIRAAFAPAIGSLMTALAPLAPIGKVIAAIFGFVANAIQGVVSWVGQLLAPVTLTKDEFQHLSASGQALGNIIGGALSAAFTLLTFPLRAVGTTIGWVIDGFQKLISFFPLNAIVAAWQPIAGFFTTLWSGIVDTVARTIDWIAAKIGWVMEMGKQVGNWFGSVFSAKQTGTSQLANGAPMMAVGAAMPSAIPRISSMPVNPAAQSTRLSAQPIARNSTSMNVSAPITVNASPGMDANEVARLVDLRLRSTMRDTQRSQTAALYD